MSSVNIKKERAVFVSSLKDLEKAEFKKALIFICFLE